MVQRIGGNRRKSRYKMKKPMASRAKISIRSYMQSFKDGDRIQLLAEPAIRKGMYHLNFHGKHGIIAGKQGKSYKVKIMDGKLTKIVIVHPVHMKKV